MSLMPFLIHTIWKGLDTYVSKQIALRYIPKHFQESRNRHPLGVYALKHIFESDTDRYICEDDYADCLRQCGLKVVDGHVYAKDTYTSVY